jgi:hypothetical protein
MGTTAISGPLVVYGPNGLENNSPVPSIFSWGDTFLDVRASYSGASSEIPQAYGFYQQRLIQTVDAIIYPTSAIIAETPVEAGVPIPLSQFPFPGVTPGQTVRESSTGQILSGVTILDDFNVVDSQGVSVAATYSQSGNFVFWNPSFMSSRRLVFYGTANTFKITGVDVYGYYVSEELETTTPTTQILTNKCYKGIVSIVPVSSGSITIINFNYVGFPLRMDYTGNAFVYENSTFVTDPFLFTTDLYPISSISHASDILTIHIPTGVGSYTLPIGSNVTISRCNPPSYNGTYKVLTSSADVFTVASTNTDTYVSGGDVFCDQSGPLTNDVRGSYQYETDPSTAPRITIYQAISPQNMLSSIGQFGIPQYGG